MSLIVLLAIIALLLGIAGMAGKPWSPYASGTAIILLAVCFIIGSAGARQLF
jgi:hypothetical protein